MAINMIGNSAPPAGPLAAVPQAAGSTSAKVETTPQPVSQPTRDQVEAAINTVKKIVDPAVANNLEFSVDKETGKTIVSVTDVQTGEMIRQIPSKELLEIARSLDKLQGLLLRQQA